VASAAPQKSRYGDEAVPNGINAPFFFMKRAPSPRPDFVPVCPIEHASGNIIDFPMIQNVASLLWLVNLGCIDLNPWYARCDDVHRPDYLHFDLDPVEGTPFRRVLETSLLVRDALSALQIRSYAKTTGSREFMCSSYRTRPVSKASLGLR